MDFDPVLLSRIQFAFLVSFHIIFPAFTIGLAAWLATLEGAQLATGNLIYRRVFDVVGLLGAIARSLESLGVVVELSRATRKSETFSNCLGWAASMKAPQPASPSVSSPTVTSSKPF